MTESDGHQAKLPERDIFRTDMQRGFDKLDKLIILGGAGLFGTMVIGFLSLVVTQH